ncbi:uncharacterized protein CcaverHIS019_0401160 [Cutaneotrichosporon cavernicola]|uniref:Oxysterol-binding protein n=1 Tax=Cutaneotrichosporon cavernicola TaxID=279322 RepID=A0AA48L3I0_9TREE|nr:uncharacterized protein CcaverHIS019_0401160 [Cutaneotrichosporon cavernicola]BEI91296.1 hypothetical protein CcaverHIS019_0401160 [Cutaneotrichosporon cavernicola]BEI99069.1 hypothetical protein CcaverHIS631_0401120 [Cutaneotrichosporon cavernicola]BEJ06843.1 hypothetical protein CcaverHIS641_0401120 [Cutaneotrichosporon cavernicola]
MLLGKKKDKDDDAIAGLPTDDDPASQAFLDDTGKPATLPEMGNGGEESKMRVLLGLLKKLVGVKDVANLRLSLPASLLEPIPNLEYWQYADRADVFAAIGDASDDFERMLAVLRFVFSKDLKFIRARLGKTYNSALGEHFRCAWRVPSLVLDKDTGAPIVRTHIHVPLPNEPAYGGAGGSGWTTPVLRPQDGGKDSETSSIRSAASNMKSPASKLKRNDSYQSFDMNSIRQVIPGPGEEVVSLRDPDAGVREEEKVTVVFLSEQTSHHPPVSAAYYYCPEKGIEAVCVDQIIARVSFPSVRLGPGPQNKGLFVRILRDGPGKGEEYQITHPDAQVNGILKGSYYGTMSDVISVTCRGGSAKTRLRVLVEYKEESWIGRPRFALEGVIYRYDEGDVNAESWTKVKQVPSDKVVGHIEGNWMKTIKYRRKGEKEWKILLNLDELALIPKLVRPLEEQEGHESRQLWEPVTSNLLSKNWGEATKQKQVIEQKQRDIAAQLKADGKVHEPRFFSRDYEDGRPALTDAGHQVVRDEIERVRVH